MKYICKALISGLDIVFGGFQALLPFFLRSIQNSSLPVQIVACQYDNYRKALWNLKNCLNKCLPLATFKIQTVYIQLANSSRGINGGAIFSAVSWSKSLPITVLGSCNILECNSKVFFAQIYFFVIVFVIASTQWGLLTVFAEIDEKWISRQCNSSFLWPFMSALW